MGDEAIRGLTVHQTSCPILAIRMDVADLDPPSLQRLFPPARQLASRRLLDAEASYPNPSLTCSSLGCWSTLVTHTRQRTRNAPFAV